jgi:hypothetical protein
MTSWSCSAWPLQCGTLAARLFLFRHHTLFPLGQSPLPLSHLYLTSLFPPPPPRDNLQAPTVQALRGRRESRPVLRRGAQEEGVWALPLCAHCLRQVRTSPFPFPPPHLHSKTLLVRCVLWTCHVPVPVVLSSLSGSATVDWAVVISWGHIAVQQCPTLISVFTTIRSRHRHPALISTTVSA